MGKTFKRVRCADTEERPAKERLSFVNKSPMYGPPISVRGFEPSDPIPEGIYKDFTSDRYFYLSVINGTIHVQYSWNKHSIEVRKGSVIYAEKVEKKDIARILSELSSERRFVKSLAEKLWH